MIDYDLLYEYIPNANRLWLCEACYEEETNG